MQKVILLARRLYLKEIELAIYHYEIGRITQRLMAVILSCR